MAVKDDVTVLELFRSRPLESALLLLCPVAVGAVQLLNSVYHDLSFAVSIPFAVVMVAFAALLAQYHLAQLRRQRLDGSFPGVDGRPSR